MKPTSIPAVVLGAALAVSWGIGHAAGKVDVGKREYNDSCAVCHGETGKGDGPLAGMLAKRIPDLTTLAARNGGVFPMVKVYATIEGKNGDVKAHGTRTMPIWGSRYRVEAAEHYVDVNYDAEAIVRARILSLAEYIYRLQEM